MTTADRLGLAAVILIWGLNFVVMKLGLQDLSPMLLGALRFALASLPLLLIVRPPRLPARWLLAYGLAQGLGQFGLLFTALQLGMTAGMASVVIQTQAFFTLLLAMPLLGERAPARQWAGLAVALAGLAAIGSAALAPDGKPGQMTLIGFVLTLGAALMWAVSNLIGRLAVRAGGAYDPLGFIVWSSLAPILPFTALALWQDGPAVVWGQLSGLDARGLGAVLYLALLATVLAYSLWTRLLQRHAPSRVAPWSLLVPVVGLWAAAMVFDERPLPQQWAGTGLVLLGLLIGQGLLRLPRRAQPGG